MLIIYFSYFCSCYYDYHDDFYCSNIIAMIAVMVLITIIVIVITTTIIIVRAAMTNILITLTMFQVMLILLRIFLFIKVLAVNCAVASISYQDLYNACETAAPGRRWISEEVHILEQLQRPKKA